MGAAAMGYPPNLVSSTVFDTPLATGPAAPTDPRPTPNGQHSCRAPRLHRASDCYLVASGPSCAAAAWDVVEPRTMLTARSR